MAAGQTGKGDGVPATPANRKAARQRVKNSAPAVMPRARVAPCSDDLHGTAETQPLPESIRQQPFEEKSPAQWAYERIILYIQAFEEQLDDTHEVAMGFAGGEAGVLQIEGIGYFAPDLLTFYGREEDGTRTQLVQHVSQLNVMLRAMSKASESEMPRRIGFRLAEEIEVVRPTAKSGKRNKAKA